MEANGNGYHAGYNGASRENGLIDHLPPQNLDAERAVLSALLQDNTAFDAVSPILEIGDFYREAHQLVFGVMLELRASGIPVDAITLSNELDRRGVYKQLGGDEFLLEISDAAPHAANCKYHAEIVRQKSVSRQIIQGSADLIRSGYSNLCTAQELHSRLAALSHSIESIPGGEPWPELALQHEPDAPPFPTSVFPEPLERFCVGAAAVTLSPCDLSGVAMLAAASAAIGQSVNIFLKRTWQESPLMYSLIVADPGKSKTPVMKLVVKPLTYIDIDLRKKSKQSKDAWEEMKRMGPKGYSMGPEPPQERAVVKDVTRETLVAILADNPRGVLADPDEATGWVGSFNEYKGKGTDRQFWLDIWSSRPISVDRAGGQRSLWVASPMVTVLGGIPPDMLGTLNEDMGRNDGFLDRLLFTFPSEFPQQRWLEEDLDQGHEMSWHSVIRKLHSQPMHFDESRKILRPHLCDFSNEAKKLWIEWYNGHSALIEAEDPPPWVPGVYSKLRAYCARFALILSRLRLAMDPEVDSELLRENVCAADVQGAIKLIEYFKGHIAKVYHRKTGGTGSQDAQTVLSWIKRKGLTEFREALIREDLRRRFPDVGTLSAPLRVLMDAGAIRLKPEPARSGKRGPKPTRTFEVHPSLLKVSETLLGAPEITEITVDSPESPF